VPEGQQWYRSIDDCLGPADTRFFATGFRRTEHDVRDVTVSAGEAPRPGSRARVGIRYPTDWSTKQGRTDLRPHLSTIDMLLLSAQLSEIHLAYAHGLDSGQRRMSWLRKMSFRAGRTPQDDLQGMTGLAVPAGTEPMPDASGMRVSSYECAVGVMRAVCEIVHPVGVATAGEAAYQSVDEALGFAGTRYFGDGFKSKRQVIEEVIANMNELSASARVHIQPVAEIAVPTQGLEGGFQPALSLLDGLVVGSQLAQVLMYGLDALPRERSGTLWMIRAVLESAGPGRPCAGPVPARSRITRTQLLPLRGGTWRKIHFTSDCGGITAGVSCAHEIFAPSQPAGG